MNGDAIDRFVKDPSQLMELCRDVIHQLDASLEEVAVAEQETQLRAIAKAIEQLERSGVTIPESLRAEKTRLAASLAVHADAKQALAQLADEFQDILKDLRERLGQNTIASEAKPRSKRSKKKLDGRARVPDVIEEMARQLESKLLPGDTVWRDATNEPAWHNNAKRELGEDSQ